MIKDIIQKYQKGKSIEVANNKEYFIKDWLSERKNILAKNTFGNYIPNVYADKLGSFVLGRQMDRVNATDEYEFSNSPKVFKENDDKKDEIIRSYARSKMLGVSNMDTYNIISKLSPDFPLGVHNPTHKTTLYNYNPSINTMIHERTHALQPWGQTSTIKNIINKDKKFINPDSEHPIKHKYWDNPNEIYSRLMELRQHYNIDPKKVWSTEDIQNLRKTKKPIKGNYILDRYSDDFIKRLFNDVASNKSNVIRAQQGTVLNKIGMELKRGAKGISNTMKHFGMNLPFDVLRTVGVNIPVTNWSPTMNEGLDDESISNMTTGEFAKDIIGGGANLVSAELGLGLAGKALKPVTNYIGKKAQGIKVPFKSKPAQKILSGRLNFTPKDRRFLVNQEGFRAPKVTETLKDQEDWFVELMKKHNPNATAVNEANLRSHVPEYNQIINSAKKAGTYMKNSDGSMFQGDPREWAMLQSKNAQWLDKRPWYTGVPGRAIKEGPDAGKLMSENFNKFTGDVWTSNNEHYANVFAEKNLSDSRGKVFKLHSPKDASTYKVDNGPQGWHSMPIDRNTHKLGPDATIEMRGFRNMAGEMEQKPIHVSKNWLNETDLSKKLSPENHNYGVRTDDIFAHAKNKGYERTRINNIMDGPAFFKNSAREWDYYEPFIDINIIHSKTPRKSVLGNDGTFSKIDPNIFGSILSAIGLGANKINK